MAGATKLGGWRHDLQHDDIQNNDNQQNDPQHNDTKHNNIAIMPSGIKLSVAFFLL